MLGFPCSIDDFTSMHIWETLTEHSELCRINNKQTVLRDGLMQGYGGILKRVLWIDIIFSSAFILQQTA